MRTNTGVSSWRPNFHCFLVPFLVAFLALLVSCESTAPLTSDQKALARILADADSASSSDDYAAATKLLVRALVLSEEVAPSTTRQIKKRLCDAYLDWARSLYWKSKSENSVEPLAEAIRLCAKAAKVRPRSKRKCEAYAARFKSDLRSINYKNATSLETIDPGYKEREYQFDIFLKQARVFRRAGNYMGAKDKLQEALRLNPYSIEATRELRGVMRKVAAAGERRALADKQARAAEVAWKNVNPIEQTGKKSSQPDQAPAVDLRSRMESLTIAEIDFKDAPLDKVFAILEKEIRGKLLSSFKLNCEGFSPTDSKWPPITFKAEKIPAYGALKAICDGVGLSLDISGDAVIISPK